MRTDFLRSSSEPYCFHVWFLAGRNESRVVLPLPERLSPGARLAAGRRPGDVVALPLQQGAPVVQVQQAHGRFLRRPVRVLPRWFTIQWCAKIMVHHLMVRYIQ